MYRRPDDLQEAQPRGGHGSGGSVGLVNPHATMRNDMMVASVRRDSFLVGAVFGGQRLGSADLPLTPPQILFSDAGGVRLHAWACCCQDGCREVSKSVSGNVSLGL